ncbi:hypothetical protein ACK34M_16525 [Aeromonas veronii]
MVAANPHRHQQGSGLQRGLLQPRHRGARRLESKAGQGDIADLQPLTGGHIVSRLDDRFFTQSDGKEGVTGVIGDAIVGIDIGEGTKIGKTDIPHLI